MSYDYAVRRKDVFTEDGQVMFLKIRDNAHRLFAEAGACMAGKLMHNVGGDSWTMLACIDRLVELKELIEVTNPQSCWAQHRVFIDPHERP